MEPVVASAKRIPSCGRDARAACRAMASKSASGPDPFSGMSATMMSSPSAADITRCTCAAAAVAARARRLNRPLAQAALVPQDRPRPTAPCACYVARATSLAEQQLRQRLHQCLTTENSLCSRYSPATMPAIANPSNAPTNAPIAAPANAYGVQSLVSEAVERQTARRPSAPPTPPATPPTIRPMVFPRFECLVVSALSASKTLFVCFACPNTGSSSAVNEGNGC